MRRTWCARWEGRSGRGGARDGEAGRAAWCCECEYIYTVYPTGALVYAWQGGKGATNSNNTQQQTSGREGRGGIYKSHNPRRA